MKQMQRGFTLIELIVVIVILGILAATALPRFIDFQADAAQAAVQGVAGGLASASAINYSGSIMNPPKAVTPANLSGVGCTSATMWQLLSSGQPTNYNLTGGASCAANTTISCSVTYVVGTTTYSAPAAITCY